MGPRDKANNGRNLRGGGCLGKVFLTVVWDDTGHDTWRQPLGSAIVPHAIDVLSRKHSKTTKAGFDNVFRPTRRHAAKGDEWPRRRFEGFQFTCVTQCHHLISLSAVFSSFSPSRFETITRHRCARDKLLISRSNTGAKTLFFRGVFPMKTSSRCVRSLPDIWQT